MGKTWALISETKIRDKIANEASTIDSAKPFSQCRVFGSMILNIQIHICNRTLYGKFVEKKLPFLSHEGVQTALTQCKKRFINKQNNPMR